MNKKQGFTLIEILVVIFIIGLLAAIIIAGASYARKKSQDTQAISDLTTVQAALQNYYLDNGSYPSNGGANYNAYFNTIAGVGGTLLTGNYLPKAIDNSSNTYYYNRLSTSDYRLWIYPKNDTYKLCPNCEGTANSCYLIRKGKVSSVW